MPSPRPWSRCCFQRGLYLDVIVARDVPPAVESDRKAFHAILANLLGNAVKYTESGGIVVQIEVSASMSDVTSNSTPVLRVRVSDTGCGIPPDRLETIFAPFEQVDEALNRRHAGTGLGLSIVKGYCELLGGRVSVASALDDGSIFTIELPLRLPVEPMSVRPPAAIIPAGLRALVADERASFRASVSTRLADLGHRRRGMRAFTRRLGDRASARPNLRPTGHAGPLGDCPPGCCQRWWRGFGAKRIGWSYWKHAAIPRWSNGCGREGWT
jgi:hypothetical protein